MELDELKHIWSQHETKLVESTKINKGLLRRLLIQNAEKRIDWLKVRSLAGMILPLIGIIFIVVPRLHFTLDAKFIIGTLLFVSLSVISYIWLIKLYLLIEKLNLNESITFVRKQLKLAEKYKLKITKYGLILAPFYVVGIFLSAGIPFLSPKMVPFYILMVIVFLISTYIRSKHGLAVTIRKINSDIEEISKLELEVDHLK